MTTPSFVAILVLALFVAAASVVPADSAAGTRWIAPAQSRPIEISVTGQHTMTRGDSPDSARQLALVDARRKAWETAVERLQSRSDVIALQLKPTELLAFTAVLLPIEEPTPADATLTESVARVRVRAQLDSGDALSSMAALRKDQDVTYDLVEAWAEMERSHQRLASQTQRRVAASNDEAVAIAREQLQAITVLNAQHLSARAMAALARTEPSVVGGRALSDQGRQRAQQLAEAALTLSPDSPGAYDVRGDLLLDALEPVAAEAEFRKSLGANDTASVRTKLAEALRLQGKFDEAVAELRAALRLDASSARAHSGLGLALRGQENLQGSVAEYEEAIRLDPDLIDAHNGLAVVLAGMGRLEEAVSHFREIVRVDPDSTIGYYNLAYALADLDRDVESAAALREVIRINPNHYNARYNLGELFRLEGKYDDSVRQFQAYLRLAPDTPQNRRNIERAKGFIEKFSD
jgi:tetratricopeptide (TPR) repeat protein